MLSATLNELKIDLPTVKKYKQADFYPELAALCTHFNVPESIFNKCLQLEKSKKTSDNLPDTIVEEAGYYLVRLPVNDPRAYLLGYMTQCDQSIGDYEEQNVIDGIKCKNNGFYVLLKPKTANVMPPMVSGKINYENFDIVGQGYAFLTLNGNLIFNYWKNLNDELNKVSVPLLKKFSEAITQPNSKILSVKIGTEWKRANLDDKSGLWEKRTDFEERLEGINSLPDSKDYYIVYENSKRQAGLAKSIHTTLKLLIPDEKLLNSIVIKPDQIKSVNQAVKIHNAINELSRDEIFKRFLRLDDNMAMFISLRKESVYDASYHIIESLLALVKLRQANLLRFELLPFILKRDNDSCQHSHDEVVSALIKLNNENLLMPNLIRVLASYRCPRQLICHIAENKKEFIELILPAMIENPKNTRDILYLAQLLDKHQLLNNKIIALLKNPNYQIPWSNDLSFIIKSKLIAPELIEKIIINGNSDQIHLLRSLIEVYSESLMEFKRFFHPDLSLRDPFHLLIKNIFEKPSNIQIIVDLSMDKLKDLTSVLGEGARFKLYKLFNNNIQKVESFLHWLKNDKASSLETLKTALKNGQRFGSVVPCVAQDQEAPDVQMEALQVADPKPHADKDQKSLVKKMFTSSSNKEVAESHMLLEENESLAVRHSINSKFP